MPHFSSILTFLCRDEENDNCESDKENDVCLNGNTKRKRRGEQTLKDRSDVVNKSLLRAIKKYFVNSFKDLYQQSRFRSTIKWARQFYSSISMLVDKLNSDLEPVHLIQIFGIFINSRLFKRSCRRLKIKNDK